MDTLGSSFVKPLPEVHLDVGSEGTTTNKASQGSLELTEVANDEGNSEGTSTNKATQDRHGPCGLYQRRRKNKHKVKVLPTMVVDEKNRELFAAALTGDWKYVQQKVSQISEAMTARITTEEQESVTVLDVAVVATQDQFAENLVKHLQSKEENPNLTRALCNAARGGRIRMVKALADKIDFKRESLARALSTAVSWAPGKKKVISYLAKKTFSAPPNDDTINRLVSALSYDDTINRLVMAGHMDIVCFLERQHLGLKEEETGNTKLDRMLGYLVSMISDFRSRAGLGFWDKIIYKCIPSCLVNESFGHSEEMNSAQDSSFKRILGSKLRNKWLIAFGNLALVETMLTMDIPEILEFLLTSEIVIDAASRGIYEFVKLCLRNFPELMWQKDFTKELVKEVVKGRHVDLFRLVNAHNTTAYFTEDESTRRSLMEAVVEWSPRCVSTDASGAAFLIQRELQWFEVVEDMSDPSFKSMKFQASKVKVKDGSDPSLKFVKIEEDKREGKTYWEIFVEQRQDLLKEAGQWMKDTSSSCSVVATLIITVAFAAAFTVPGGNNGNTGLPIFMKKGSFIVFAIADALALFSSITATLMFLAILTSRYTIQNFRSSLPTKMILGLTFLFLSLVFMLVAFGSAFTIILSEQLKWIYIPIILLAAFPVILFAILQLPLYYEMVQSTCCPPLYRPIKIWK